jgi:sugar phosphate isomerase/epimerase
MQPDLSRRQWLANVSVAGAGLATVAAPATTAAEPKAEEPVRYSLNTSTIRGQKVPLPQEVEIAAKAGYHAIEPWISELDQYAKDGGSLKDLGKRIRDQGLTVESAIGFAEWIVEDDARRKKGMEQARLDLDLVQQIGGKRLAAPPAGATDRSDLNLYKIAERYRALVDLGSNFGVVPQVELWGFSKTLSRLGEVVMVAVESHVPSACILIDVYHLYKGGSGFASLKLIGAAALQVIHVNDYPADPPREKITDAQRVYPGDGVAPLKTMLRDLKALGFRGVLSLELFNREYWKQDPLEVARTGLRKLQAVVKSSIE